MSQPAAMTGGRLVGHVKWFDAQKGWGFIEPTDGSDDVFVHQQSILAEGFRSLDDGEEVEYEIETDANRRKRAVNVTGPGGAAVRGSTRNYGPRGGRGGPAMYGAGGARNSYDGMRGGGRRGGYGASRYDDQGGAPRYEEHRFDNRGGDYGDAMHGGDGYPRRGGDGYGRSRGAAPYMARENRL
eukprot:Blabericola_migrator_1__8933@NODE_4735_length_1002_cov_776_792513_g2945_i0_p1_GENE_NODE_4735_length_1002_cov_776_792513_g2945_i0NODE_4735_length_1002_cov_776_792513_g2945_i0_p1_ORF_typecomplete_len184_score17_39CSD/PF00313_22/1e24OB_RNB/PF08206_11/0_0034OB_RNB/PF08206_11/6_4e03_NODE_4735_length_1002_cov_776_792513_g2945_i0318869